MLNRNQCAELLKLNADIVYRVSLAYERIPDCEACRKYNDLYSDIVDKISEISEDLLEKVRLEFRQAELNF